MVNKNEIKKVREAVRRKCKHKVLAYLDLVPAVKYGKHPETSNPKLSIGQQARYCITQGNLLTMQEDFLNAESHYDWAHTLLIKEPISDEGRRVRHAEYAGCSKEECKFNPIYNYELISKLRASLKYWQNKCNLSYTNADYGEGARKRCEKSLGGITSLLEARI